MATVGVESIEVWILEEDDKWDDKNTCLNGDETCEAVGSKKHNRWKIDGTANASGVINIKVDGLGADSSPVFASNRLKYNSYGNPSPKAEVELLDIPLEMQAAILGREFANNTYSINSEVKPPHLVIEMIGNDIKGGKQHVVFPIATATISGMDMATREEKGADPKNQSITFTGLADSKGEMTFLAYDPTGKGTGPDFTYTTFQEKWLKKKGGLVTYKAESEEKIMKQKGDRK